MKTTITNLIKLLIIWIMCIFIAAAESSCTSQIDTTTKIDTDEYQISNFDTSAKVICNNVQDKINYRYYDTSLSNVDLYSTYYDSIVRKNSLTLYLPLIVLVFAFIFEITLLNSKYIKRDSIAANATYIITYIIVAFILIYWLNNAPQAIDKLINTDKYIIDELLWVLN